MSATQTDAESSKRPMTVKQVHESGPYAWYAIKSASDGYQYAAPGSTREDAIENLATFLVETLERYELALRDIAANKDSGPTCATYAADALVGRLGSGKRVALEGA